MAGHRAADAQLRVRLDERDVSVPEPRHRMLPDVVDVVEQQQYLVVVVVGQLDAAMHERQQLQRPLLR